MIYLQAELAEPIRIYLSAPSAPRPRICEVVEAACPLEEVLRLAWAHGLVEKLDPDNCQVICKRDDGTHIVEARFDLRHTVDQLMRGVGKAAGTRVTVCTFSVAHDGNLHVICTPTVKPHENTHVPYERGHVPQPVIHKKADGPSAGVRAAARVAGAAATAAMRKGEMMTMTDLKRELCIRE
jgi:hypothetical protein